MWRKLGASSWMATQNVDDVSPKASALLNMIEWWMCLNMPPGGRLYSVGISRFPSLIAEIKTYVEQHVEERCSLNQVNHLARQKSRALRDRIEQVARQRDQLASLLSEVMRKIIELYDRIAELE